MEAEQIAHLNRHTAESPALIAAARALCKQHADVCGVNEQDTWNLLADDFKAGARAALDAAARAQAETSHAALAPDFITFTGVDDDTDPAGLVMLADDYPVEFGLLFSPKRQGLEPRYPRLTMITWFAEELPLRWSAHLCGADARAWIEEDRCDHDALLRHFQRVQINTTDPLIQPSVIGNSAARRNLRAILQCRGSFPLVASVDVLFDASGGRGIEPEGWPGAVRTTFCGYAGGLKPENVSRAVRQIGAQGVPYWIDMESGVRDERDRFDLAKCRAVCEAVYGEPRA